VASLRLAIKLSPLQAEILSHRLEVPDALADALERSTEQVEAACEELLRLAKSRTIVWDALNSLSREVLIDAVEGSTYYGASSAGEHPRQLANISKAGDSLADKLAKVSGQPVYFPSF
jgi:hypothetical protein